MKHSRMLDCQRLNHSLMGGGIFIVLVEKPVNQYVFWKDDLRAVHLGGVIECDEVEKPVLVP